MKRRSFLKAAICTALVPSLVAVVTDPVPTWKPVVDWLPSKKLDLIDLMRDACAKMNEPYAKPAKFWISGHWMTHEQAAFALRARMMKTTNTLLKEI